MNKHKLLKEELKGLDVTWLSRDAIVGSTEIDMARVNGHSIIWHKYAYTVPYEPTVEVRFMWADDVEGHVPIKGLRKRVES